MFNFYRLTAAAELSRRYATKLQDVEMQQFLPLQIQEERQKLATHLLCNAYSYDFSYLKQRTDWCLMFYVLVDVVDQVSYSQPNLFFSLRGIQQKLQIEQLPNFKSLSAAYMILSGYSLVEYAGELVEVHTPSGSIRHLRDRSCDCSEFLRYGQCNHRDLYEIYAQNRTLFVQFKLADLKPITVS